MKLEGMAEVRRACNISQAGGNGRGRELVILMKLQGMAEVGRACNIIETGGNDRGRESF